MSDVEGSGPEESGQGKDVAVNRRYEFENYAGIRHMLDQLAELSEREGYYPDLSFGRTHLDVRISNVGQDDLDDLGDRRAAFIAGLDALGQ